MKPSQSAGNVAARLGSLNTDLRHHARECMKAEKRGLAPRRTDVDAIVRIRAEITELKRGTSA